MPAKKPAILTADDDPQILRLVARNLQLEGYEVVTAIDGQEALEHLEAERFDLAILDVMMPKLDGFTVCARVFLGSSASWVPPGSVPRVVRLSMLAGEGSNASPATSAVSPL